MVIFCNIYNWCSYIDDGKNPELYSKHQLEQTLAKYQAVGKKVEAYKASRHNFFTTLPHYSFRRCAVSYCNNCKLLFRHGWKHINNNKLTPIHNKYTVHTHTHTHVNYTYIQIKIH